MGIEDNISQTLIFLIFLLCFYLEYEPGSVVVAEDELAELSELYGVVVAHFGVQETEAVLGDDHVGGVAVSLWGYELAKARE